MPMEVLSRIRSAAWRCRVRILARSALSISLSTALLVGCGGSQPTGVPLSPLSRGLPAERAHPDVSGFGTLFAISRSGKETVIHNFGGPPDGANPSADLIDVNGTLYGTTSSGGANNGGTVFAVTASGAETVLHSFGGSNDGSDPVAGLVSVKGTLYGTTLYGEGTITERLLDHTVRHRSSSPQLRRRQLQRLG
jgi:uncharacterized repeat protein (TIGR03803 family)